MTKQDADNLECRIARLTEWEGETPRLWRVALEQADVENAIRSRWSWPRVAGIAALVVIAFTIIVVALVPATGRARDNARLPSSAGSYDYVQPSSVATPSGGGETARRGAEGDPGYGDKRALQDLDPILSSDTAQRYVVRKATIELSTDDVRGTFLKASLLISEAHGEFIEESSMAGGDGAGSASIVLRVGADRLSDVMNKLRALGNVKQESLNGDDVTSRVVDIGARLRNEQRIESELLELLDSRENAPLDEVLAVRRELQSVRQRIEQLTAQRDHLSRLVSLATILVLIQMEDAVEHQDDAAGPSLGMYWSGSIGDAWSGGLHGLADAVSFLIEIVVGGIVWWAIATAAIIGAWRLFKRQQTHSTA